MLARLDVKKTVNTRAMSAIVKFATWLRPCCSSRISVLVGEPLTTKVPVRPAARLAPKSPMMSRLMSTLSPCFMAKLREVAALWAMIRITHESEIAST